MKNLLIITIILSAFSSSYILTAQGKGSSGGSSCYESRYIVQMPTAGVIDKGHFLVYSEYFSGGGFLLQIGAAPFRDFNFGISFSGTNFVGAGEIETQKYPGIQISYRIINETLYFPAVLIGVNTQGREKYLSEYESFLIMSPGIFLALSKTFNWQMGEFSLHGGINYSIEGVPSSRLPNIYFGIEHSIGSSMSLNLEYNAASAIMDESLMKNRGLLNLAWRISISEGFTIELQAVDLLENLQPAGGFRRNIGMEFIKAF